MKVYNAFTGQTVTMPTTPTLHSLRNPAKYWVISDVQLKRDLKGRTIKDVYRENRALRGIERGYMPRWDDGSQAGGGLGTSNNRVRHMGQWMDYKPGALREEYLEWCASRGHTPHPASIDSEHPLNCHREKAPRRETIKGEAYAVGGKGAMPYAQAMAMASAIHAQSGVFASIEQVP